MLQLLAALLAVLTGLCQASQPLLEEGGPIGEGEAYYMDLQEVALRRLLRHSGVEVIRIHNDLRLRIPGRISFQTGNANLGASTRKALTAVVPVLTAYAATELMVVAHTDAVGSRGTNQTLSEARAQSVANFLVSLGLPRDRVFAVGKGESDPIATNDTEEGRAANRRVDIDIHPRTVPADYGTRRAV